MGALAVSGVGVADGDCWVVDANDQFVGECESFAPGATSTRVRFQNAGVDFYFQLDAAGGPLFTGTYLLGYTETDCSGQPYLPYACGADPCLSPAWVAYRGFLFLAGIADWSQAPVLRHIVALRAADGSCELQTPYDEPAYPAFTAPLPTGTEPLRMIHNPNRVFGDAFELGNPSRWSGSQP
ncbi:MAG: hypothetical protein H6511_02750 [Holophagales bacterium]|nr:hypothetical protein [Holophagales bacterium]